MFSMLTILPCFRAWRELWQWRRIPRRLRRGHVRRRAGAGGHSAEHQECR